MLCLRSNKQQYHNVPSYYYSLMTLVTLNIYEFNFSILQIELRHLPGSSNNHSLEQSLIKMLSEFNFENNIHAVTIKFLFWVPVSSFQISTIIHKIFLKYEWELGKIICTSEMFLKCQHTDVSLQCLIHLARRSNSEGES